MSAAFGEGWAAFDRGESQTANPYGNRHYLCAKEWRDGYMAAGDARAKPQRSAPYPEFCRHPDKCAGLSYCPRDPTCAD